MNFDGLTTAIVLAAAWASWPPGRAFPTLDQNRIKGAIAVSYHAGRAAATAEIVR